MSQQPRKLAQQGALRDHAAHVVTRTADRAMSQRFLLQANYDALIAQVATSIVLNR